MCDPRPRSAIDPGIGLIKDALCNGGELVAEDMEVAAPGKASFRPRQPSRSDGRISKGKGSRGRVRRVFALLLVQGTAPRAGHAAKASQQQKHHSGTITTSRS
eukprot:363257-Chlamydomonas_euryale.AAC.14